MPLDALQRHLLFQNGAILGHPAPNIERPGDALDKAIAAFVKVGKELGVIK